MPRTPPAAAAGAVALRRTSHRNGKIQNQYTDRAARLVCHGTDRGSKHDHTVIADLQIAWMTGHTTAHGSYQPYTSTDECGSSPPARHLLRATDTHNRASNQMQQLSAPCTAQHTLQPVTQSSLTHKLVIAPRKGFQGSTCAAQLCGSLGCDDFWHHQKAPVKRKSANKNPRSCCFPSSHNCTLQISNRSTPPQF